MKAKRAHAAAGCAFAAALLAGCAGPRIAPPQGEPPRAALPDTGADAVAAYERRWRDTAESAARQGRLTDAAWAWDVVAALRPDDPDIAKRRLQVEARIQSAVAERWPRAQLALARGDGEAAARLCLEILALVPDHAAAADTLRSIERQRAPRAVAPLRSRAPAAPGARNEVEHASLLAGDGDVDAAVVVLEPVALRRNADPAARALLADLYVRQADRLLPAQPAAAVAALERAVRVQPGHAGALRRLRELRPVNAPAAASSRAR